MAGVAGLGEGRGGVDGVPPPPQHVGGIQELGVGDGLQTEQQQRFSAFLGPDGETPKSSRSLRESQNDWKRFIGHNEILFFIHHVIS